MDGLFIQPAYGPRRRPNSKKEVKEIVANDTATLRVEITSFFSNLHGQVVTLDQVGSQIEFVGPNPHTDRRFYGTITCTSSPDGTKSWSVK